MVAIIFLIIFSSIILILIYSAIISYVENELKAAVKLSVVCIITIIFVLIVTFFDFKLKEILIYILTLLPVLVAIILFIPINRYKNCNTRPKLRIDERDTMFSRKELVNGTENFEEYYKNNNEKLLSDNKFRKNPGLGNKKSLFYDTYQCVAADSSFTVVESLTPLVKGAVSKERLDTNANKNSKFIKNWITSIGAHSVGVTELKDYHIYSYGGRRERYGKEFKRNHKYAVAITVEMSKDMMDMAPYGPTLMESAQQYLNSGVLAVQLSEFIRKLGYEAQAHIDANYEVVCPLVARDAGLGEIGRMGLLMTPDLGPRVRIAVVTTNLPLIVDKPKDLRSILDFCTICKKCADVCPSVAISSDNIGKVRGADGWQIDQELCFNYWTKAGTDCGRCVSVCPYSHPNNALHNFVRWGLKQSWIFRRFALKMDDLLYSRKPKPRKVKEWLKF